MEIGPGGMKIYPCYYGGELMPWANSVVAENLIFLSGSEGRDPNKKQEYPELIKRGIKLEESPLVEGAEAQTTLTLTKIKERLEEAGSSLEHIVFLKIFISKRENQPLVLKAFDEFWEKNCADLLERPRAGTLLVDVGLAREDQLVEIEVVGLIP